MSRVSNPSGGKVEAPMRDADPREELMWESGWEGHTRAQRRRLGRLPLAEKLRWLEEAQQLVLHLRRDRASGDDGSAPPRPPE